MDEEQKQEIPDGQQKEIAELRDMLKKVQESVQDLSADFLVRVYEQGVNAGDSEGVRSPAEGARSPAEGVRYPATSATKGSEAGPPDVTKLQAELSSLKRQLLEKDLKESVLTLASKYDLNGPVFYSYLKGSQDCTQDPATGGFSVVDDNNRTIPLDQFVERFAGTAAGRQLTIQKPPPTTGLSQMRESAPETLSRRDLLARIVPDKMY